MNKLLKLAKTKIGCGYVFGAQGEIASSALLVILKKRFGIKYYEFMSKGKLVKAEKWLGKQVFDCSGLIVWALQQLGLLKPNQDYTAASLYNSLCKPIKLSELQLGDLLFIENASGHIDHMGIYAGAMKTVEAIGTDKGVVFGDSARFNLYGRLKFDLEEKLSWREIIQEHSASEENSADWQKAIVEVVKLADEKKVPGILKFLPLLLENINNRV